MATTCPKCRAVIAEPAKFCPECGAPVGTSTARTAGAAPEKRTTRANGNGVRDLVIILGTLLVVTVLYFIFRTPVNPPQPQTGEDHPPTTATPSPQPAQSGEMGAALTNLPTDYNSLVMTGNTEMDHGNYPVAAEAYRRALAIDSTSADVRTDYGACLHGMGMPDRAIEEFKRVLANDPKHSIAHFNLGLVFYQSQKPDSARYYWKKYLEIDPNGTAADAARNYLKEVGG